MLRPALALSLAVAVALMAAACGSSGGDTTIKNSQIPFTFTLPDNFKQRNIRQGSSQGAPPIVAYGIDNLNIVDVRKSAAKELSTSSLAAQVTASLRQLGFTNERAKTEKHSGTEMVVFSVDNKVGGKATNSKLYFFSGGGGTWELECQSSGDKANELKDACNQALDSVKFKN
jgi:hypothetical protein